MSRTIVPDGTGARHLSLGPYTRFVEARLEEMAKRSVPRRIRERDPSVWSDESASEVTDRLGWLDLPEPMDTELHAIEDSVCLPLHGTPTFIVATTLGYGRRFLH